jgi:UDP-2,3-diacylglucosamine pyrophosphatase LpxH
VPVKASDRLVVFSDVHMGDGGGTDDYKRNAALFEAALREYYLPREFTLVLNGDIEELYRFSLKKIRKRWDETYALYDRFAEQDRFFKVAGNHDLALQGESAAKGYPYPIAEALRLTRGRDALLVFHGHQTSNRFWVEHPLVAPTLRYIANPLRIRNYSVSHSNRKRFKVEGRVYDFAVRRRIACIIGHTHRPLFESLSKRQRLAHKIEQLCRVYISVPAERRRLVRRSIEMLKKELRKIDSNGGLPTAAESVYHAGLVLPCLFNTGCAIGKRGITGIEIADGKIALAHWFDRKVSRRYLNSTGYDPEPAAGSDIFRMVINEDDLDYVFNRIRLLS